MVPKRQSSIQRHSENVSRIAILMKRARAIASRSTKASNRSEGSTQSTGPIDPLLYCVNDAARRLGISGSSIWRLLRLGRLCPTTVLGRTMISEAELQRLVVEATRARSPSPQPAAEPDETADGAVVQAGLQEMNSDNP